jgi:hypothetical protein
MMRNAASDTPCAIDGRKSYGSTSDPAPSGETPGKADLTKAAQDLADYVATLACELAKLAANHGLTSIADDLLAAADKAALAAAPAPKSEPDVTLPPSSACK